MTDNEIKNTVKDRLEDISTRTFTIGACPEKVYQRFINYCKNNAKNIKYFQDANTGKPTVKEEIIYHVGLRLLLDASEIDAKNMVVYEKLTKLESRINALENALIHKDTPKESKVKTFGGK
jgi:hypothetical protein